MQDELINKNNTIKIYPWNSTENPVKVNCIRYNQDSSLLIVATSKGYKIFSSSTFKELGENTDVINNFGDIHVAELYFSSKLVFLLPSKFNKDYTNNEIIIFDDYFQKQIGSLKTKKEKIQSFSVSKNLISIITMKEIIVVELKSLQIIEIIEDIAFNDKILSFNPFDYLAYTKSADRKTLYIETFKSENGKITSRKIQKIDSTFDFIQILHFSPDGNQIAVLSIFGNKLHIYKTQTGQLKNCIFLGPKIQTLDRIFFSEKKPNYLLFIRNDKIFNIYKLGKAKDKEQLQKCICNIDNDNDLVNRLNELDLKNAGLSKPRSMSKSKSVKEPHVYSDYSGRLLFADFERNKHKDLIFIDQEGKLIKYQFNKKKNGKIEPISMVQWI